MSILYIVMYVCVCEREREGEREIDGILLTLKKE